MGFNTTQAHTYKETASAFGAIDIARNKIQYAKSYSKGTSLIVHERAWKRHRVYKCSQHPLSNRIYRPKKNNASVLHLTLTFNSYGEGQGKQKSPAARHIPHMSASAVTRLQVWMRVRSEDEREREAEMWYELGKLCYSRGLFWGTTSSTRSRRYVFCNQPHAYTYARSQTRVTVRCRSDQMPLF